MIKVYNNCYLREDGSDYRGVESIPGCVAWDAASASLGMTTDNYPELGNHNYCRNPGGKRNSTYCLPPNATSIEDGLECSLTEKRKVTCHEG